MNAALNQTWAAHIEKWRSSGLSAKAFCQQEGLVYHQFGYWRQKFLSADDAPTGSKLVPVTMAAESHHTTAGKTAQSDKWMWVTRGGPPDKPSVLFDYDPTRAGHVPVRLLEGFSGVLQVDGYSGYGKVCRDLDITRIGCWDHARRKFVEATRSAVSKKGKSNKAAPSKADVAISKIRKLYAIESKIDHLSAEEKYTVRQELALPVLQDLKTWLDTNQSKVPKDSLTFKAIQYTLNQWESLVAYCDHGFAHISNALAENAIRPFAVGRRNWLFADSTRGANAGATCYSLIETAKANGLEPSSYLQYLLDHIAQADTLEKLEALLPWNMSKAG